jgi:hypothetical protein
MVEGRSLISRRLRFFFLHDNPGGPILQWGLAPSSKPPPWGSSLFPMFLEMAYKLHLVHLYYCCYVSCRGWTACESLATRTRVARCQRSLARRERRQGGSWECEEGRQLDARVPSTVYRTRRLIAAARHGRKCKHTSKYVHIVLTRFIPAR